MREEDIAGVGNSLSPGRKNRTQILAHSTRVFLADDVREISRLVTRVLHVLTVGMHCLRCHLKGQSHEIEFFKVAYT